MNKQLSKRQQGSRHDVEGSTTDLFSSKSSCPGESSGVDDRPAAALPGKKRAAISDHETSLRVGVNHLGQPAAEFVAGQI